MTDSVRMWVMCSLSTLIGAGMVFAMNRRPSAPIAPPKKLSIPLESVLPKSRFADVLPLKNPVVVEFMDYQCPPCRSLDKKFPASIRRIVRHLPLSMHSQAMPAAILAEQARLDSKLDALHPKLIDSDLKSDSLAKLATEQNISEVHKVEAKQNIAADVADAKKIGIPGTPTMIVCLPSGEMYQTSSLSQVKELIR